jgi:radical SAM superfamily enzyme YgiQ (UPF0313 family)
MGVAGMRNIIETPTEAASYMLPKARFKCDVILIAPREMEVTRAQRTYREKNFTSFTERVGIQSFQQGYIRRINESLGLECLARYLRIAGLRTAIVNCNVSPHSTQELIEKIKFSQARLVGISLIYRPQVAQALELVNGLETVQDVKVCMGGALASFMPHQLLSRLSRLDAVVYGEAEETFRDYACALVGVSDPSRLPGIAFRDGNKVIMNQAAPPLDLTEVLPPCRDTLTYLEKSGWPTRIASMYTSRGCFARCTFCTGKDAYNVERRPTYRFRAPADVVDEMQYLKERFDVKFIYINDDNFLGYGKHSFERVRAIAREILRRDLRIPFATECRVDALDPELLLLLKAAGMSQVLLGIESGSNAVLKRWKKGATAEKNREAIALVQRLGINLEPGYILIDAHTNADELAESLHFIEETDLHRTPFPTYLINRLSVYPGTEIERILIQEAIISPSKIPLGHPTTNDPDAIVKEFHRLEYVCSDRRTEVVWRSLRWALEPVEQCIEDLLPRLTETLLKLRRASLSNTTRARAIDLVRKGATWRRQLGTLVLQCLRLCINSYDIAWLPAQFRWLRRQLMLACEAYEDLTLGMPMQRFIGEAVVLGKEVEQYGSVDSYSEPGQLVAP